MLLREHTIGTLNLFRTDPTPLVGQDLALGQALADITTIAILQERALAHVETVVEQLQGALNSRVVIEQAKGILSIRGRVSVDDGFKVLRLRPGPQPVPGRTRPRGDRDEDQALNVLRFGASAP
jgi:hypothetical protein